MSITGNWTAYDNFKMSLNREELCHNLSNYYITSYSAWSTYFRLKVLLNFDKDELFTILIKFLIEKDNFKYELMRPMFDYIVKISEKTKEYFGLPLPVAFDALQYAKLDEERLKKYLIDKSPNSDPNNWFNYGPERFGQQYQDLLKCLTEDHKACDPFTNLENEKIVKHLVGPGYLFQDQSRPIIPYCSFGDGVLKKCDLFQKYSHNCLSFNAPKDPMQAKKVQIMTHASNQALLLINFR